MTMFGLRISLCARARFRMWSRDLCSEQKRRLILRHRVREIQTTHDTIPEMIWENVDRWPDHTAVVCSDTGRSYTYRQLQRKSADLAKSLTMKLGLKKGSTMAVMLPNVPEYPIALLGAMEIGLVVTTVNPIYTTEEITRQLQDSDSRIIVTVPELYDTARAASRILRRDMPIITVRTKQGASSPTGSVDFAELCEAGCNLPTTSDQVSGDDIAVLPYSSGTTGLPKGVQLTHRNIVSNMCQIAIIDDGIMRETSGTVQDVMPCFLPMFHIYGLTANILRLLSLGTKIVTVPKFAPDSFVDMLARHRPDHLFLVPPIVVFLAMHPSVSRRRHLDSLRTIISGAAPLAATDIERLWHKAGREIPALQGYGLTETSPGVAMTPFDRWKDFLGSVGTCVPATECRVVSMDDDRINLGPGCPGELLVRGPQVMRGYHKNEQATREVLDEQGWLRTGDVGYYDANEVIWITDRLKELIKVKGYQVAPAELEAVIRNHPLVADAAVIGVAHPFLGEAPKAFVVPKSDARLSAGQVQEYVAEHVASYKRLEGGVAFIDSIPKNPAGKILRKSLRLL